MPFPNPYGRPSKLTPESQEQILNYLRVGATHRMAAKMIGVDEDTFSTWYRTNDKFRREVDAAEEQAKTVLLVSLHKKARNGSVQAATWLLERRGGRDFAPPKAELDIHVNLGELPDDALDELVDGRRPALLAAESSSRERTA